MVEHAPGRFDAHGITDRVSIHAGSFRDDPLPAGADAISLIRVLYDHSDDTVAALLKAVHDRLPDGGRLITFAAGRSPTSIITLLYLLGYQYRSPHSFLLS
ncbi:methyltransferase [Okeania sp. SIO2B9]|uniref:methyltransferase n=1 Tax=Okeania sp. SIO2B9 TaxID=2607782 RepID=UPI00338F6D8D